MEDVPLTNLNEHIVCPLCKGYLIDATTVTECLHTFCKSCIVKYLEENNTCPNCKIVIHQSHPLQYIGHDRTMQDIVYKIVPGLQMAEEDRQKRFYEEKGMPTVCSGDAEDGESKAAKAEGDADYHRSDEQVSILLQGAKEEGGTSQLKDLRRKYIRCSSQATIMHIKKFLAKKLQLNSHNEVDILCNEELLGKDHTLKFVAVTRWRFKDAPLILNYRAKMEI